MDRYVIVSTDAKDTTILDGPILASADWDPGAGRRLLAEKTAAEQGYAWPAPPPAEVEAEQLRAAATAYLDLATPTAAQTAAQVRALTRQVDALARLAHYLTGAP